MGRGARTRLEQALCQAVRGGRLTPGTTLPSSRVLAQIHVARNTVTDAYEGWLTARQGRGARLARETFAEPSHSKCVRVVGLPLARTSARHAPSGGRPSITPGLPTEPSYPAPRVAAAARTSVLP
ncbi:GntR family transcriptional regulator [Streptomyces carpinensis]|uniref:GntR family transcriptional regulator n=1 Tax=Streptomyces carpinensis TaxID=66369 RepID=UPI001FC97CE9|nr:GntR family transcriptional regulator [Streptomyces carpinensis]